jgi:hypothetical protein
MSWGKYSFKNEGKLLSTRIGISLVASFGLVVSPLASTQAAGTVTNCTSYGSQEIFGDLAWALQGGGDVTFACSGAIVVSPEIVLSQDTVIDATGQSVTLSGNNTNRVLYVNAGVTAKLINIIVTDGKVEVGAAIASGGGIHNRGNLKLIDSSVSNSRVKSGYQYAQGGGIYNYLGILTLENSTVSGNHAGWGGGIFNVYASLTLENSIVSNNSAGTGGGIFTNRRVSLTSSTISDNRASLRGGGIFTQTTAGTLVITKSTISNNSAPNGGGIYNNGNYSTIESSTISNNSADYGGGIYIGGYEHSLTVENSTVSGNNATSRGGGIYNAARGFTLVNSTVSNNSAPYNQSGGIHQGAYPMFYKNSIIAWQKSGKDCGWNYYGYIRSRGYNIVSDGTCTQSYSQPTDLTHEVVPLLGSLQNNGGPTHTHALLPDTVAIDWIPSGSNGCGTDITEDQRGVPRPFGTGCDVGAFEFGEIDSDGDGIPDEFDSCPLTAPTNGLDADEDGCPDTLLGLISIVEGFAAEGGKGLVAKLNDAAGALARGNTRVVEKKLSDFIDQVEGMRGSALTDAEADLLVEYASNLIALTPEFPI